MLRYIRNRMGQRVPFARFCGEPCRSGLHADRCAGAIYAAIRQPEGSYSVERWSLVNCVCAYCGADVPGRALDLPPNWPITPPLAALQRACSAGTPIVGIPAEVPHA